MRIDKPTKTILKEKRSQISRLLRHVEASVEAYERYVAPSFLLAEASAVNAEGGESGWTRPPTWPWRDSEDDRQCALEPSVEEVSDIRVASIFDTSVRNMVEEVRGVSVILPSQYHSRIRFHSAMKQACEVERKLRQGQAHEALDEVRTQIAARVSVNMVRLTAQGHKELVGSFYFFYNLLIQNSIFTLVSAIRLT